ncbi:hypothetical protein ScPMuIL_016039 [Solemya velum]
MLHKGGEMDGRQRLMGGAEMGGDGDEWGTEMDDSLWINREIVYTQLKMGLNRSECLALVGIVVELAFFATELVIGEQTKSIALVADSYRVLTDAMSLSVSGIFASKVGSLKTKRNTFGWVRADVLGAFINGIFFIATMFSVLVESLKRLVTVQELEKPHLVLVVGGVGLLINTVVLLLFGTKAYRHSRKQKKTRDIWSAADVESDSLHQAIITDTGGPNSGEPEGLTRTSSAHEMKLAPRRLSAGWMFIHVLGNLIGSLTVITIAALGIYGKHDWCHYADPVLTICMVAILVTSTCPLLKESANIMLQTVPQHFDIEVIKTNLKKQIPELLNIHELHIWELTGQSAIATIHFISSVNHDCRTTMQQIRNFMLKLGITHVTIQPEISQCLDNALGSNDCILTCTDHEHCISKTCCHAREIQLNNQHNHAGHSHGCHSDHSESPCTDSSENHSHAPGPKYPDNKDNSAVERANTPPLTIVTSTIDFSDSRESLVDTTGNGNTDSTVVAQIVSTV